MGEAFRESRKEARETSPALQDFPSSRNSISAKHHSSSGSGGSSASFTPLPGNNLSPVNQPFTEIDDLSALGDGGVRGEGATLKNAHSRAAAPALHRNVLSVARALRQKRAHHLNYIQA